MVHSRLNTATVVVVFCTVRQSNIQTPIWSVEKSWELIRVTNGTKCMCKRGVVPNEIRNDLESHSKAKSVMLLFLSLPLQL